MHTGNNFECHIIVVRIFSKLFRKDAHHVTTDYDVTDVMDELVAKMNTYSPVWAFFGLKKDNEEDDDSVICRLCRAIILVQRGNTSNLFSHLKVHHEKEHALIEKSKKKKTSAANKEDSHDTGKQITLGEAIERTKSYTHGSHQWKEVTESFAHFMPKEMIPINTVEKPGFRSMVRKLDPRYEVPSRKYFSKTALPLLYAETHERVTKELQEAEYYSVTKDLWSSDGKLEPYLAVMVHYINKE